MAEMADMFTQQNMQHKDPEDSDLTDTGYRLTLLTSGGAPNTTQ